MIIICHACLNFYHTKKISPWWPVYLNQKAAMYVCAHALSDSLEYSYKLLGNVLDCVSAGVAALEAFRSAYDFDICIL